MVKSLVIYFLFPFPLSLLLVLSGILLLWFTGRQRVGKILTSFGFLILIFCSAFRLSSPLVESLEGSYPAVLGDEASQAKFKGIRFIVVLGAGHYNDPDISIVSQQSHAQLARTIEGLFLYRKIPDSKLILSGGSKKETSDAEMMSRLLASLGVREEDMILETTSQNTFEQARNLQERLGKESFLLVTSAMHMRRAVALFKKMGLNPVPAPAGHLLGRHTSYPAQLALPSSRQINVFENALYEYLGWFKDRVLGRI